MTASGVSRGSTPATDATTVLVVASDRDRVAARLARELRARGRDALLIDGAEAARMFTIRVDGASASVTPSCPMFMRRSAWWRDAEPASDDERFLTMECYSTVWAAAALTDAPVVNRPGVRGWPGRLTAATIEHVAGDGTHGVVEVHASGPERATISNGNGSARVPWGKNVQRGTGAVERLPAGVPLRARAVDPNEAYEIVTVVGTRAFTATNDALSASLDLCARSIELAQRAELLFATVAWAVHGGEAEPVRIDANAKDKDLRFAWPEIADALCEELLR